MAEEQERSSKTEDATPRRLQKGRERGQVAVSQEVKSWAVLAAGTLGLVVLVPSALRSLAATGRFFLESADAISVDTASAQKGFGALVLSVSWDVAALFALITIVAVFASIGQIGFLWAPAKIAPELSKISLMKGVQRMVSIRSVVEFAKGIAKLVAVGALAFALSLPLLADLELLIWMDAPRLMERIGVVAVRMAGGTVAVMSLIAIADYVYQRHAFNAQMRMTRQEVRDEYKQSEGDPQIKGRIRKLRAERAQRRMMAAVPKADVVITNPTHYAVALEYKMEAMAAPKVVAKGVDHLARRIREVAAEHGVPVVENPPLARALHATVDLDGEVPPEHYQAVAQVIGYVMRLKGQTGQAGG
jgi:flagellar biosynthetic protein FlhB